VEEDKQREIKNAALREEIDKETHISRQTSFSDFYNEPFLPKNQESPKPWYMTGQSPSSAKSAKSH
jgi:hypothetical protein